MTLLKVTQGLAGINMLHHYHNILTDTLVQGSITQNPYSTRFKLSITKQSL